MSKGRNDYAARAKIRKVFKAMIEGTGGVPCGRCGRLITPEMKWHVGHIVDLMDGGETTLAGTRPEHARCNTSAGGKRGAQIRNAQRAGAKRRAQSRTAVSDPRNTMTGW